MKSYRAYVFDLDGTLFRGDQVLPYASETLAILRKRGAMIRFLTNNSSQTREFYRDKLRRLGFQADLDEVHSSATGTASYIADHGLRTVFVLGMVGLMATLEQRGLKVVNRGDLGALAEGDQAEAVAVGISLDLTYPLLNGAMQQIHGGAAFVATNPDRTFPLEGGKLTPGAGSMVAAVQACTGVEPFVVGKPNPFLVELALREAGVPPSEALAVGDRMDTDIESGERAGCDTHLVLTGVDTVAPPGQSWSEDLRGLVT